MEESTVRPKKAIEQFRKHLEKRKKEAKRQLYHMKIGVGAGVVTALLVLGYLYFKINVWS